MNQSSSSRETCSDELFAEMSRWPIFDPHTHIDPHRPAARHFEEILGYHYYTELAHSAGMPAEAVRRFARPRRTRSRRGRIPRSHRFDCPVLVAAGNRQDVPPVSVTTGSPGRTWESCCERPTTASGGRSGTRGLPASGLETVFLTNEFDDPLEGWDTRGYVPCLRIDDLVLKLHEPRTIARLETSLGMDVGDVASVNRAIGLLFERFVSRGAGAVAVSLPPDFVPRPAPYRRASTPIRKAIHGMELRRDEIEEVRCAVFWTLAELCAEFRLPFDLMIGPIRNVYPQGVAGGRDLFDRRVSLYDYRDLFNHFDGVIFPVSTLSPDASAELVAYSWIFPNVLPNGPLVVLERAGVHRSRPACAACKPCPRRSCWDIIQMRTSSSSSLPNSTCTGGSWRMSFRKKPCAAGAGRWNGPLASPNSS